MAEFEQRIQQQREAFATEEFAQRLEAYAQATNEFVSQDVYDLAQVLQERYICDLQTGKVIRLASVEPWKTEKVGKRYKDMDDMDLGDYYAFYFPVRGMTQSLIVAQQQGVTIFTEEQKVKKTCVRILRADRYDFETNSLIPLGDREGAVAEYLGIGQQVDPEDPKKKKKLSERGKLVFLDDSGILYLIHEQRKPDVIEEPEPTPVDPQIADAFLDGLIR